MQTWKWSFLFILIFVFAWSARRNLLESSLFIKSGINQWDMFIGITGDPFMLLYLILPVTLLLSCLSIRDTHHTSSLIRVQSWQKWVLYSVKNFSPVILVTVILLAITSLIMTAGLPYESSWSSFSKVELTTFNYMSSFSYQSNLSPFAVLIVQLCLLILFFLVMHAVNSAIYLYFVNLLFLGAFSFAVLLYSLISFRYFPDYPSLIAFNYMSFPSSYGTYHQVYPAFICLIGALILSIYGIPLLKKWSLVPIQMWFKNYYPYVIYTMLCLLGIASPQLTLATQSVTVWDTLYLRFYGISPEGSFSLISFLFYVVVTNGFVYLFQVYITDYLSGRFYYMVIRYSSTYRWFASLGSRLGLWAALWLACLMMLTISSGLIFGQSINPLVTVQTNVSMSQIMYHFLINGWLQILNGVLLVFLIAWVFTEVTMGLIALAVLVLAALPMINVGGWLPAGLSSMGYLNGQWEDVLRITGLLLITLLFQLSLILLVIRNKDIAFH
ncbi:hypothetical protein B9T62_37470 [Paenibacillus donghaensis]|uniref:Permease n=2 Tax=Paenibacillus donghaensis TaxID=414771 RepID=A0A2Z2KSJ7_9BACL|nr:hypothetical protein B9T62_37470 [Paenibacillus donghaensis]